jgi:hypothetical protein
MINAFNVKAFTNVLFFDVFNGSAFFLFENNDGNRIEHLTFFLCVLVMINHLVESTNLNSLNILGCFSGS